MPENYIIAVAENLLISTTKRQEFSKSIQKMDNMLEAI